MKSIESTDAGKARSTDTRREKVRVVIRKLEKIETTAPCETNN